MLSKSKHSHIAFLIMFGPEVRAFIHSGLIARIAKTNRVTIITRFPSSAAFYHLDSSVSVIGVQDIVESDWLRRLRYYTRVANEKRAFHWYGRKRWRHSVSQVAQANAHNKNTPQQYFWYVLSLILSITESISGRVLGTQPEWKRLFKVNKVDVLITASYSSPRVLPALQTTQNLGIKTISILNSWKDIYVNPHVSVAPNLLVVWNDEAVQALLQANRFLRRNTIYVAPSLHLQHLVAGELTLKRDVMSHMLGLDPECPYICYTAASPSATVDEVLIVESIVHHLRNMKPERHIQLLLRLNPMEDGSRFRELAQRYPDDLILQQPIWEWDKKVDWCCALAEDTELWHSIIYYSIFNISIPSTVTMEFLTVGRPVINICFDARDGLSSGESNLRFWEAEFYREIRESQLVVPVFGYAELFARIDEQLGKPTVAAHNVKQDYSSQPLSVVSEIIKGLISQR